MRRAGLDVVVQPVEPGRPNVIGVLEGRATGPTLMFCGHLDTVGVEGMTDPFVPRESGGRLYGRGAQDMKGGVAAMIAAAAKLREQWTRGRLVIAAVTMLGPACSAVRRIASAIERPALRSSSYRATQSTP